MTVVNVRVTMASKGSRFEFVTEQGGCALDSVGGCGWNEKCGVVDDDVGRGECNCGSLGVTEEVKLLIWKRRGRAVGLMCGGRTVDSWGWLKE